FSVDQRERELKALNALLQSQHGRMKALEENTHIDREQYLAVARFMAFSLESGSPDMRGHAEQVATWTLALSRSMNLNVEGLAEAAYLHDVGGFPAAKDVLERLGVTEGAAKGAKGGPSTGSGGPAGVGTTADHCTTGEAIARLLKLAPDVGRAIRHHHENYDGSGYPDGLSGDRIPVAARLLRVAESYTDMVSEGVRKGRLTEQEAVGRMKAGMRKEYDPVIVEGLEKLFQKRERPSEGELLSTVSHELRSPLSFLVGYSELLASTHELPPAAKQAAQEIYSEASHMARLVEDMMDLSRLELGKAEIALSDIDLAALIERSVTGAKLKSAKHRVEADVPAALPPVRGNADRLMQVLDNLVDNAIKYSPDGGRVVVRAVARDGEVVVSVSDQGIGMPKDKLELIFEKFQRLDSPLKNKVSGTGIGLNLCRHLVQAHGGRIWAESEEGKGSTLFFTIPVRR
ncbi:MAG: HD domain-containing protein, partial [Chloroflexi bacterium]|nr:HD domain-containing protein [Chloroflexota bacterium]